MSHFVALIKDVGQSQEKDLPFSSLIGHKSMGLKEETKSRVTEDVIETVVFAAKLLTGHRRRRFHTEMFVKYCNVPQLSPGGV
jgi:hypothetical protein